MFFPELVVIPRHVSPCHAVHVTKCNSMAHKKIWHVIYQFRHITSSLWTSKSRLNRQIDVGLSAGRVVNFEKRTRGIFMRLHIYFSPRPRSIPWSLTQGATLAVS